LIVRSLRSRAEVSEAIACLNAGPYVSLDTETTGLNRFKDKILSVSVGYGDNVFLFPPAFAEELLKITTTLVLHHWRFDAHMLAGAGADISHIPFRDTMLMHHLLDETSPHGLDHLVQHYFQDNYKEVFWGKYESYESAPEAERQEYEAKDVLYTGRLYDVLRAELGADEIPDSLVDHAHRLALVLWRTEQAGVAVDLPYLTETGTRLQGQIQEIVPRMRKMVETHCECWELDQWATDLGKYKTDKGRANCEKPAFSFDSSKQLGDLLYTRLKLPKQYDQKTKRLTTGDDALAKLETAHSLVPVLRQYRGYQKVYGSYIEGTLERMHNGRIYPSFNVNGTKTGRISHSDPNLGQLPRDGGIRGIYVPDEGHVFVSADYKQLEVVLAAHFSQDRSLLRVVLENASLHDITKEGLKLNDRNVAKTINFALQYGAGQRKIQEILKCSEPEARLALSRYWETYSGLKALIDECHRKVDAGEPIVNPFGRKRRPPSSYPEPWMKGKAKRQAFNALIQGTGGDLTSRAFYLVDDCLRKKGIGRGLFTVHDEILICAREDHAEEASAVLVATMRGVGAEINLTVPLAAEASGPMKRWED
jgi:DNA polymerase I